MSPTADTNELLREAELIEANRLDSRSWVASITCFDLIRNATGPDVMAVVDSVRSMDLNPSELAGLLRQRAEGGSA